MPHPIPRHKQKRGIGDKIEHIVEPAMRIISGPTVQLRLDLQYPAASHLGDRLQLVGIHQRLPVFQHSTTDLLAPFAMCHGSPGLGLLRGLRPTHGPQSAADLPTTRPAARRQGRPQVVPTFTGSSIGQIGAQLYPGSIATVTP